MARRPSVIHHDELLTQFAEWGLFVSGHEFQVTSKKTAGMVTHALMCRLNPTWALRESCLPSEPCSFCRVLAFLNHSGRHPSLFGGEENKSGLLERLMMLGGDPHHSQQMRMQAHRVLTRIASRGDPAAVGFLVSELGDPSPVWKVAALKALGSLVSLSDRETVETIINLMKDRDSSVRNAAADALGGISDGQGDAPTIESIAALCQHDSMNVRSSATKALAQVCARLPGNAQAIETIEKCLARDPHWYVRVVAVEVLPLVHAPCSPDLLRSLFAAFDDGDHKVRTAAVSALEGAVKQGDREAFEMVRTMLSEPSVRHRGAATAALEFIVDPNDPSHKQYVEELLHDEDWEVSNAANNILARIYGEGASDMMIDDVPPPPDGY